MHSVRATSNQHVLGSQSDQHCSLISRTTAKVTLRQSYTARRASRHSAARAFGRRRARRSRTSKTSDAGSRDAAPATADSWSSCSAESMVRRQGRGRGGGKEARRGGRGCGEMHRQRLGGAIFSFRKLNQPGEVCVTSSSRGKQKKSQQQVYVFVVQMSLCASV